MTKQSGALVRLPSQPRWLWLILLAAAALVLPVAALAEGVLPSGYDSTWTGGNGWCDSQYCFRAWPGERAIALRWVVAEGAPANLQVVRLMPGSKNEPAVVVASSQGAGEFSYDDTTASPGYVYTYQLVQAPDRLLGDGLEAGLAAQTTDPGGGTSQTHKVYVPLISRGG